jgi:hypothetical protein
MTDQTSADPGETDTDSTEAYGPAKDRLRDALRWVVSVFGAIAALAVAGISFPALSQLSPSSGRFWMGIGGALLAVLGATTVILMAVRVLGGPGSSLIDMARTERDLVPEIPDEFRVKGARQQTRLEKRENRKVVEYLRGQPQLLRRYGSINEVATEGLRTLTDPSLTMRLSANN